MNQHPKEAELCEGEHTFVVDFMQMHHMDVADVAKGWTVVPLDLFVRDGKVFYKVWIKKP